MLLRSWTALSFSLPAFPRGAVDADDQTPRTSVLGRERFSAMSRRARRGLAVAAALLALIGIATTTSFEIRADVVIDAPVERVWDVVVDFPSYGAWNTQLSWLEGVAGPGAVLKLRLAVEGAAPYEFKPTVSYWEPNVRFAWLARTGLPRVFDGEHFFELEPIEGGKKTRLVNRERYSGALSLLMQRLPMMAGAPRGFAKMNDEIKARAESQVR